MSNEKSPEKLDFKGFPGLASYAGDGTRTHTILLSADFESAASAIPPHRLI